jgi:serine protease AprX
VENAASSTAKRARKPARTGKTASPKTLAEELQAPTHKKKNKARWSREVNGVHMVQLLVSSDGADPQMRALRAEVARQGGKVQVVHRNLQTLTVLLPATKVTALSQHDDVKRIIPNRDTQSTASALESITGATTTGCAPTAPTQATPASTARAWASPSSIPA